MNTERLEILLELLAKDQLDNEQADELQQLLAEEKTVAEARKWIEKKLEGWPADKPYNAQRFDPLFTQIVSIDRSFEGSIPATKARSFSLGWLKYAAAAAIVIIAGWFLLERKTTGHTPVVSNVKETATDLVPGSDKAILTLSDGSKVEVLPSRTTLVDGQVKIANNGTTLDYRGADGAAMAPGSIVYNTMTTPRGGQYKLTLSDGTKVWLNASSSVTFPTIFPGSERKVQITGEVYFEVSRDPSRPFHVSTDKMDVEVLGTHFNVNAYTDEPLVSTTLLEGSVKIKSIRQNAAGSVVLKPGEQAQMDDDAASIAVKKDADLEQIVAWKNGINSFKDADIKTIMRQVSRWYDVDVVFEGTIPPSKTFTGEFSRSDNASKIFSLFDFAGIRCRIEGKKVFVMQ